MQAVVPATRGMTGPSTAEPVVNECRKPRSPVLSAVLTSVSAMPSPRCTRILNGDFASSGTVLGATGGAVEISTSLSMERAIDHVHLLFASQAYEVHRIAGHANGQARVVFGMVHRIEQGLAVQHIDVHAVAGDAEEAVHDRRQVRDPVRFGAPEAARNERRRQ